jgi:hypothetical protein
LAVFFRSVTAGQQALIQGMRRISDLAKMKVLFALFGTMIGIPLVYFLREDGVVPTLISIAAVSLVCTMVVQPTGQDSAASKVCLPSQAGSHVAAETRLRLYGKWPARDGHGLCGPHDGRTYGRP